MSAGRYDITIEQGATWTLALRYESADETPIDLTNYTAAMTLRDTYGGTIIASLTTGNGKIALGGEAGTIDATLSATATAALDAPATGVYDLELTNGATVTRLIEGTVTISPEVTQ